MLFDLFAGFNLPKTGRQAFNVVCVGVSPARLKKIEGKFPGITALAYKFLLLEELRVAHDWSQREATRRMFPSIEGDIKVVNTAQIDEKASMLWGEFSALYNRRFDERPIQTRLRYEVHNKVHKVAPVEAGFPNSLLELYMWSQLLDNASDLLQFDFGNFVSSWVLDEICDEFHPGIAQECVKELGLSPAFWVNYKVPGLGSQAFVQEAAVETLPEIVEEDFSIDDEVFDGKDGDVSDFADDSALDPVLLEELEFLQDEYDGI